MKRLKKWLSEHDISQAEFADSIDVKQPTVSDWLTGKMNPRSNRIAQIAHRTGIPIEDLIADCAKSSQKRLNKHSH
jgi:transcriptional regulator with XRE-family HTH domain